MSREYPAPGDGLLDQARLLSDMDLDGVKAMVIESSIFFEDDAKDDRGFPTQDEIDEVQSLWIGDAEVIFEHVKVDYDNSWSNGDYSSMALIALLLDRISELWDVTS